jgi:uncharacterized protein YigA (DUF484 family)
MRQEAIAEEAERQLVETVAREEQRCSTRCRLSVLRLLQELRRSAVGIRLTDLAEIMEPQAVALILEIVRQTLEDQSFPEVQLTGTQVFSILLLVHTVVLWLAVEIRPTDLTEKMETLEDS